MVHSARRKFGALTASAALVGLMAISVPVSPVGAHELTCDVHDLKAVVPADTTLVSAATASTPVHYCRVDGYVITTDPGPNRVNFMVALPDARLFKGRYFFIGLGGTAGYVPNPPADLLRAGYAVAGTDTGTTATLDWKFMINHAKALDHDRRGGHVAAVATQAITKAYYHTGRLFRYHSGCSGGGRMGTRAATYYPNDYDGIIIGTPSHGGAGIVHFGMVAKYLVEHPDGVVPNSVLAAIGSKVLADWDAADGARDGMIWDPSVVRYSDEELDAVLSVLTPAQRKTIDMIRGGYDIGGPMFVKPYPLSGIQFWGAWMGSFVAVIADTYMRGTFGLDFDYLTQYNFTVEEEKALVAALESRDWTTRTPATDYLHFRDAGGKLIMWHGVNDPVITWNGARLLYDEIVQASANLEEAQEWTRLFPVPGISHCGGGVGPQDVPMRALDALVAWVEDGEAPDSLVGTRPSDGRTFLLCPYPQRSVFKGGLNNPQGLNVNDASNWVCEGDNHED
jgi:feruloyl esterase